MKANELRIGNLVKYQDDSTLFTVIEINNGGIGVKNTEQDTCMEYDFFEPIPLTEEWLLKFGFIKDNCGLYYLKCIDEEKNNFWIKDQSQEKWGIALNLFDKYECYLNDIQYVNQLQNLYFALTGEELQIIN